jgi:2-keto-4-pentenoate hydratase/2-oxohepta-3-ene-1,7-dioic acid hydratase in catechol pathway
MIFPIDELISYASRQLTLEPGDLIATGTPAGVALGSPSPRWLQDGDVVAVEIEHLGTLTNPVRAA